MKQYLITAFAAGLMVITAPSTRAAATTVSINGNIIKRNGFGRASDPAN